MRILFICGGLAPGRDGVGDYARKLASKLIAMDHQVTIVSINDQNTANTIEEIQESPEPVNVFRIPNKLSWKERLELLEQFAIRFKPDLVSFQYVPYSFHEKGLPLEMIWKMTSFFKNVKLHIMLHELWVDGKNGNSIKSKLICFLQKGLLKLMVTRWKPSGLATSIPLYQKMLKKEGIAADIIPIFSNIGNFQTDIADGIETVPQWLLEDRKSYLIGCNFGSFYNSSWNLEQFFNSFQEECIKLGKQPLLYSIGNLSAGKDNWDQLADQFPKIKFLTLGAFPEAIISYWFTHFTDFGMVTTPYIFAGKSGSYMAFKQHGLSCFCNRQDLKFDFDVADLEMEEGLIPMVGGTEFHIPAIKHTDDQVSETSLLFLNSFKRLHTDSKPLAATRWFVAFYLTSLFQDLGPFISDL